MNTQEATQIAETINANLSSLSSISFESGSHTIRLSVEKACAWAPNGNADKVRVYINCTVSGDNRHAPRKIWWDSKELHFEYGPFCNSGRKQSNCDDAMEELSNAIKALFVKTETETKIKLDDDLQLFVEMIKDLEEIETKTDPSPIYSTP